MSPCASTSTSLMHRFGLFIERLKWTVVDATERHYQTLGPLSGVLWIYIGRTARRFAALHARFVAGKLTAPRLRASRPAAERAAPTAPTASEAPRRPRVPSGPVLVQFYAGYLSDWLLDLLADPEMQALLAASPQAGRLLRPLWRRLRGYPLPELLRPPPKPPRAKQPLASVASAEAPGDPSREPSPNTPPLIPPGRRPDASGQRSGKHSAKPTLTLPWSPPLFKT